MNFIQYLSLVLLIYHILIASFLILSSPISTAELSCRPLTCQISSGQLRQIKMKVTAEALITYYDSVRSISRRRCYLPQCYIFPCEIALSEVLMDQGRFDIFSLLKEPQTKGCWNFIDPGAKGKEKSKS